MRCSLSARLHPPTHDSLQRYAELDVDAGICGVAQVIHAVNIDDIHILRVEPIAWPAADESERVSAVLEAVIAVIGLGHAKPVVGSKVGLVTVIGNAATTVLRWLRVLLLRISVLLLRRLRVLFLCAFFILLFGLRLRGLLLRTFLILLCRLSGLLFFLALLSRLVFLFFFLVVLFLLGIGRTQNG